MGAFLKSLLAAFRPALLSESALVREMSERPVLGDTAFFQAHYGSNGIPEDIPIRTRRIIAEQLGKSWHGIHPTDNILQMDEEFDFADVMFEIAAEFGIRILLADIQSLDGTFDSAVRYVASPRRSTV